VKLPRALASPALHMIVIGVSLFVLGQAWSEPAPPTRPRLEIPASRLEQVGTDMLERRGRAPTPDEWQVIREQLIDEEVLVRYAISLDMQADPAVQTRLAQIAQFVDEQPNTAASEHELAERAIELGLHESDLIVRRILADRARRLIRAVMLVRQPAATRVEAYFAAHANDYAEPAELALALITINTFKWPDTAARARELRARIDAEALDLDAAKALSDASPLAQELPLASQRELEIDVGPDFAAAVFEAPLHVWSEPIASRHGHHLVYVRSREHARVPALEQVRTRVEQDLARELADEWLALRLQQLRADYEIVVAGQVW
jgi:parvulin-like peptidyl-prolyl isomerase